MNEDGLSARAADSAAGSLPEAATGAVTGVGKPVRGPAGRKAGKRAAAPLRARKANGKAAKSKQPVAAGVSAEPDNVVWAWEAFAGLDLVQISTHGLYLDLAACRKARHWLINRIGDPPPVICTYKFVKLADRRVAPEPFEVFTGYGCPIVLSVLREPGEQPDVNLDEFKIGWVSWRKLNAQRVPDGRRLQQPLEASQHWLLQPQRVNAKHLNELHWMNRLHAAVVTKPEQSLAIKIIEAQALDKRDSPLRRLPSPGLVCEAGFWNYGFPYSEWRPGDARNPARRFSAELDDNGQAQLCNAAGGTPSPIIPIAEARLGLLADYLLAWDQDGRALTTFAYGARSLCASVARIRTAHVLLGTSEYGKTTAARFAMRCASRMGSPEFRLAGEGGTVNSVDDLFRCFRDCILLIDDKFDDGAEATRTYVSVVSAMHEGGSRRRRLKRDMSAAENSFIECGVIITAQNQDGVRKSRQRRTALIVFDKPPENAANLPELAHQLLGEKLNSNDFETLFESGLPAGEEAMFSVNRYVLRQLQLLTDKAMDDGATAEVAEQQARERFAESIETRRRQITGQLLIVLQRHCPGQHFLKSVAGAFAEEWNGAVLLDRAAGFAGSLDLDTALVSLGPFTSRLRRHIIDLAVRAAGVINGLIAVDDNAIAEQFPRDLRRVLTSGRWGIHGHDDAMPAIKNVPAEALGWIRDPDASRRPPPRPGEVTWRRPARVLGYFKGNEIWIELQLFGEAFVEVRDSDIDYSQRDAVLRQLRDAGILIRGSSRHLTTVRRIGNRLRRFIVIRADRIWPPEAKGKAKDSASAGAEIIDLPTVQPGAAASATDRHDDNIDVVSPANRIATAPDAAAHKPAAPTATGAAVSPQPRATAAPVPVQTVTPRPTMQPRPAAPQTAPVDGHVIVVAGSDGSFRIDRANKVWRIDAPKPGVPFVELLDWCERTHISQLQLHGGWCAAAGLPAEWSDGSDRGEPCRYLTHEGLPHPWINVPDDGRWRISNAGQLHRWTYAHRNGGSVRQSIEIAFPGYDNRAPFHEAADAEVLAHALAEFRAALTADNGRSGFGFRGGPAETFQSMQRSLASDQGAADVTPQLAPADFPPPALPPPEGGPKNHVAGNVYWVRRPTKVELLQSTHCVVFDKNGAWLGAMAGLRCGVGRPQHITAHVVFDKNCPGWWRVRYRCPSWPAALPVPGGSLPPDTEGWLETGTVAFLFEIGAEVEIFETHLWSSSTRALDRLQYRVRAGRSCLMSRRDDTTLPEITRRGAAIAYDALKGCIVRGIGWFDRRDDRSSTVIVPRFRPHWRDGTIARAVANLFRDTAHAATRSGIFPIGFYVDALIYLTSESDPAALAARLGLPLGQQLGQYKVAGIIPAEKVLSVLSALPDDVDSVPSEFLDLINQAKRGDVFEDAGNDV